MDIKEKINKIKKDLKRFGNALIAYSGGVDSSVISALAKDALGNKTIAITAKSETTPKREIQEAKKTAKEIGIKHKTIKISEFNEPNFQKNTSKRCYYCKKNLYKNLKNYAEKNNYNKVIDGTNATETQQHRPGYKAIKEHNIYTPLAEYKIKKPEVREIASIYDLSVKNKPSMACLASRITHKEEITPKKLKMIEKAENYLKKLGFNQYRVRKHRDIARIELSSEKKALDKKTMNKIDKKLKQLGFTYVTLDLHGYQAGSMEKNQK